MAAVLVWGYSMWGGAPHSEGPLPAPTAPTGPRGPDGPWTLAWHDEFDGDSLNTDAWQPSRFGEHDGDAPFEPEREAAWFSPSNVHVRDGNLVLTLDKNSRTISGRTYPYRSAVVQAKKSRWIEPGTYVEARIEVPQCSGCWPAFWFVATDRWPPEIDGFEFFGTHSDSRPSFNYHPEDGGQTGPSQYGGAGIDYRKSFHTYGVLWENDEVVPYLDGVAYPAVAAKDVTSLPLMLILNLSVQADHQPAAGSQMRVDWVRTWSRPDR